MLYLNGAENRHLDEDYLSGAALRNGMPEAVSHMASVNTLNPGIESDMGRSTSVHGIEVTLGRA